MEPIHERSLRERAEARLTANYSMRKFIIKKTKQKNTRIIHAFLTPEVTAGLFVRADGPGVSGRCGRWYHPPLPHPPLLHLLPVSISPVGSIHAVVNTVPWMG